jgi:hypothetical protein
LFLPLQRLIFWSAYAERAQLGAVDMDHGQLGNLAVYRCQAVLAALPAFQPVGATA